MKKRLCPNCGCAVFEATQVRTVAVLVDGYCSLLSDAGCLSDEPICGPFICTMCGAEYQSLDNLMEGPYYKNVVITNHFKDLEEEFCEYQIGKPPVTRDKLDDVIIQIVKKLAESDLSVKGYFCYFSKAYAGDDDVSGVLLVDRGDNGVDVTLTEYKPQSRKKSCH